MRAGFVAIIGRPNVGKSSLVNALVGEKVAIVSEKPQTTRNRIMGVVNGEGYQLVLLDTPGIQSPRTKLGTFMEGAVSHSLRDVEAVIVMVEAQEAIGDGDIAAYERGKKADAPLLLVANKADLVSEARQPAVIQSLRERFSTDNVFLLSTKTGQGLFELLNALIEHLPVGVPYFPEDMVSDKEESFLCAEMLREKMLWLLRDEVPHGVGVELEKFMERDDGIVEVHAVIYCERSSHKGIIIGKDGKMLKKIATLAREEMEGLFGTKVFLKVYVKTRDDWRNSPLALRELGYD